MRISEKKNSKIPIAYCTTFNVQHLPKRYFYECKIYITLQIPYTVGARYIRHMNNGNSLCGVLLNLQIFLTVLN